jgi:hypothetical protein
MNNHPHEDAIRIHFPEPSKEMSRRMDSLFQNEKQKCRDTRKRSYRSLFYAMAATILLLIFVGSGWLWWEQDKTPPKKIPQAVIASHNFGNARYFNPKALVFVKPRKPSGAFDFSTVLEPNQNPERVTKRIVLHWPSQ